MIYFFLFEDNFDAGEDNSSGFLECRVIKS